MKLDTYNNPLPVEIISLISIYLNMRDFITFISICKYYLNNKNNIIKIQTNIMLNYLNISINELPIIGIEVSDNYVDLFKSVRNYLYKQPPKVITSVSRLTKKKSEIFNIEAYVMSSTLYNKFLPGIFPNDYPLYIRAGNVKYFFNLIMSLRSKVQFYVTFFATLKKLSLERKLLLTPGKSPSISTICIDNDNISNKIVELNYLETLSYIRLCKPTYENINEAHVFTLWKCLNNGNLNIYYSSINENHKRKNDLLKTVHNVYSSSYTVTDDFDI